MRARSFGSDPALVGRHVAAFVDGIQSGGGAAAVKHYPGFGGASVNSDDALATITRTAPQLERDLAPFRQAVRAGVDLVMVSHGRYVAVDRLRPASASPAFYRRLREGLGFEGVAITDSLNAAGFAAAARTSVATGCVRVIAAGADVALLTGSLKDALDCRARLIVAARAGTLSKARIDEAVLRVLVLKARLGLLGRGERVSG
jgi:beta-N-acetylhexosaminidase